MSGPPVYDVMQGNPISTLPPCGSSSFDFKNTFLEPFSSFFGVLQEHIF